MSHPRPRLVVTLPARTVPEAVEQLRLARDAGADAAELRVDRLRDGERAGLERLFPGALPMVATYRSRAEGGDGADAPAARREILLALADLPFRWIDVELARDLELLPHLPSDEELGRIVSSHVADRPGPAWAANLRALESVDGVGKLVAPASVGEALATVVPEAARVGEELVLLTTGPSGALLRAWARRFGFPLVYASLPESPASEPVEASQIPVDRLRPFLEADPTPPLFAVCGRPVGYSRSPTLHAEWMRATGDVGLYIALEFVGEQEFVDALAPLAEGGFRGLNVTQPLKVAAVAAASEVGPGALACGAANCLSFEEGGVRAENTDLVAILRRLQELREAGRWDGRALTVLGAGGAARATLAAARELGAHATVVARRPEAAAALAALFGGSSGGRESRDGPATLVVHATEAGREAASALDVPLVPLLGTGTHVLDWVYAPAGPVVRQATVRAGATYEDGARLLVYQAAASYELWWGHPPEPSAVASALSEVPCAG